MCIQLYRPISTWTKQHVAGLPEILPTFMLFAFRKGIRPVKTERWGADVVICLERGADLHMAQLMPLPLTVCCFSKIQIGFTFWYRLTRVVPDKGCVCVSCCKFHMSIWMHHDDTLQFFFFLFPLCDRQCLRYGGCLEVTVRNWQDYFVFCCVRQLCTTVCTQISAVLQFMFSYRVRLVFVCF